MSNTMDTIVVKSERLLLVEIHDLSSRVTFTTEDGDATDHKILYLPRDVDSSELDHVFDLYLRKASQFRVTITPVDRVVSINIKGDR